MARQNPWISLSVSFCLYFPLKKQLLYLLSTNKHHSSPQVAILEGMKRWLYFYQPLRACSLKRDSWALQTGYVLLLCSRVRCSTMFNDPISKICSMRLAVQTTLGNSLQNPPLLPKFSFIVQLLTALKTRHFQLLLWIRADLRLTTCNLFLEGAGVVDPQLGIEPSTWTPYSLQSPKNTVLCQRKYTGAVVSKVLPSFGVRKSPKQLQHHQLTKTDLDVFNFLFFFSKLGQNMKELKIEQGRKKMIS